MLLLVNAKLRLPCVEHQLTNVELRFIIHKFLMALPPAQRVS
jgi:hypothetical protein